MPEDIPKDPKDSYKNKGWISWGDWLGTGRIATQNKVFLPFEEARELARALNLKTGAEWKAFMKNIKFPHNIPKDPGDTYKNKGWISFGDWLGTGRIATQNTIFLPFEEARKFARSLNLKTNTEWKEYVKSSHRPAEIPYSPWVVYKNEGWISFADWLGAEEIVDFSSFESAREFARSLKFDSKKEWGEYSKSGDKPCNIPGDPSDTYKGKGWVSWGDWLGTGRVASYNMIYRPFPEAREFVHSLNLKNQNEWRIYSKSDKKPNDIPASPDRHYKHNGWLSFGDWLGTKIISNMKKVFLPFSMARKLAQSLNFKSHAEWIRYCNNGKKPNNIPTHPHVFYSSSRQVKNA